jgi:hypothetical protein
MVLIGALSMLAAWKIGVPSPLELGLIAGEAAQAVAFFDDIAHNSPDS